MTKTLVHYVPVAIGSVLLSSAFLSAQSAQPVKNPKEGNPAAIRAGSDSYRARCAGCHGADGKGAAGGSNITELWTGGATDQTVFQYIRRGFTNTIKPHSFGPEDEVWAIMAYLRSLDADRPAAGPAGNSAHAKSYSRRTVFSVIR